MLSAPSLFRRPPPLSFAFASPYLESILSQVSRRPLVFSALQLTDDDDQACQDENFVKNLGKISLAFYRVKNVRRENVNERSDKSFDAARPTHEQAKKAFAVSHQTR